jgi:hypothetical protein
MFELVDFWGPLAAGIVCIGIGAVELLRYRGFRCRAKRVPGVVFDIELSVSSEHGHVWCSVLDFTTHDGFHMRTPARVWLQPLLMPPREQIVAYDPLDPRRAEVVGEGGIHIATLTCLVVVGAALVTAAWLRALAWL